MKEMKSNSQFQQVHKQQQGEVRKGSLLELKDAPDLQNFCFQREQLLQQYLKQQERELFSFYIYYIQKG
jgi:hypothetical protein